MYKTEKRKTLRWTGYNRTVRNKGVIQTILFFFPLWESRDDKKVIHRPQSDPAHRVHVFKSTNSTLRNEKIHRIKWELRWWSGLDSLSLSVWLDDRCLCGWGTQMGLLYDCVRTHSGSFSSFIARTAGAFYNETLRHVDCVCGWKDHGSTIQITLLHYSMLTGQHSLM